MRNAIRCWLSCVGVILSLAAGVAILILAVFLAGPPIAYAVGQWWSYWGVS